MKHATPEALQQCEPLLAELRKRSSLQERRPGVFYLKSKAFLHFHEDPSGLFADVRISGADFDRVNVSTARQQAALLSRIEAHLSSTSP